MSVLNIGSNTGDSGSVSDARIDNGSPQENNYGAHPKGYAGALGGGRELRECQRFNCSAIAAGNVCSAAVLNLYDTNFSTRGANCTITVYEIAAANAAWQEGTGDGSLAQTGKVCWSWRGYNVDHWAGSNGCATSGTDYTATALGSAVFTDGVSGYRTITFNATGLAVVQSWFGGTGGGGILLIGTGSGDTLTEWHSKEGDDAKRPYLAITYAAAAAVNVGNMLLVF